MSAAVEILVRFVMLALFAAASAGIVLVLLVAWAANRRILDGRKQWEMDA